MKIKTNLILFLGLVCLLHSCTKTEFEGPSIETLYGDFEIIEPLKLQIKILIFQIMNKVGFHCEFNKPVEWKITILGLSTGAIRKLQVFQILLTQI